MAKKVTVSKKEKGKKAPEISSSKPINPAQTQQSTVPFKLSPVLLISLVVVLLIIILVFTLHSQQDSLPPPATLLSTITTLPPATQQPQQDTTPTDTLGSQEGSSPTSTTLTGGTVTPPAGSGTSHIIEITGFKFSPLVLDINEGDTVTWVNHDRAGSNVRVHKLKTHSGDFMTERLYANDTFSYTFTEAGEFTYIDTIFTDMNRGRIIVHETPFILGYALKDIPSSIPPMAGILAIVAMTAMVVGVSLGYSNKGSSY